MALGYIVLCLFSLVAFLISCTIVLRQYRKKRYQALLYAGLMGCASFVWVLFNLLAAIFIEEIIARMFVIVSSLAISIGTSVLAVFFYDSMHRVSIDPRKTAIISALSALIFLLAFIDPNAVIITLDPLGDPTIQWSGAFQILGYLTIFLIDLLPIYYFRKLSQNAPKQFRTQALILYYNSLVPLIVGIFFLMIVPEAGWFSLYVPGIDVLMAGISVLIVGIIISRHPKLMSILLFKPLRITVLDTESGIQLYTHTWAEGRVLIDENLFSSMLQGISLILNESVQSGNAREIRLDKAFILLNRSNIYPIAYVLVVTQSSRTLEVALSNFTTQFEKVFAKEVAANSSIFHYEGAIRIVDECFPFIPEVEGKP